MTDSNELSPVEIEGIYEARFTDSDLDFKRQLWRVLVDRVFQRYISPDDTVLDLGAGTCEFINAVRCKERIAVDLNPQVRKFAIDAVPIVSSSDALTEVKDGTIDVVFSSNLFEHLADKKVLLATLREVHRVLQPQGKIMILIPNVRYLPGRYWDYFDHHIPLTHLSMTEALQLAGFSPERVVPRFLPYTVKQRLAPRSIWILRLYLRLPFLWPIFGRQMLIVAGRV